MKKVLEICCTNPNCKTWFESPYFHNVVDLFNVSALKGLKSQCPVCSKMVSGTAKNVRIRTMTDEMPFDKTS